MSEKDGTDIDGLWNGMMNFEIDSRSIKDDLIQIQSRSLSDPPLSDIDFKNKMAWVWTTLKVNISYLLALEFLVQWWTSMIKQLQMVC